MGTLRYRIRLRDLADSDDLWLATSVRGGVHPYIKRAPVSDGQEVDPIRGKVTVGQTMVEVIDWWASLCITETAGVSDTVVASVEIDPESLALDAGGVGTLRATVRNAAGQVLPGKVVTWDSDNDPVATVGSDSGDDNHQVTVTGVSNGTATITATCETVDASILATVTISDFPHEPADMTPIVIQPFNSLSIAGFTHFFGNTTIVTESGFTVARVVDEAGIYAGFGAQWDASALDGNRQRLYMRLRYKPQVLWRGHYNGYKMFYPVFDSVGPEHGVILEARTSGTDYTTGAIRFRFLPQSAIGNQSFGQNVTSDVIVRGAYNTLEALFQLNTPGQLNGRISWWINGVLAGHHTNVGYASASETGAHWFVPRLVLYAGGGNDPVNLAAPQYQYLDECYISVGD